MFIQSYNVSVSSQRTFSSLQPSTVSATSSLNYAQYTGITGQEGITTPIPAQVEKQQNQNKNSQGQNQNGQGQNGNSQGENQNGKGKNVNNQGEAQTWPGFVLNNQSQSKVEEYKTMLENVKKDNIDRLSKILNASRWSDTENHKIPSTPQELRTRLSQLLYELLTGRSSKLSRKHNQQPDYKNAGYNYDFPVFFGGIFGLNSVQRALSVDALGFESFQIESETVSYKANGVIQTADGKTITLDISMEMSRQFVSFMNISGEALTPCDPLVINYGGTAASLMGEKFSFDLTMDGNMDSIAILGEGSGFLAIDKNGDGIINDGSELFGPSTGCGFSELRKYDTDGNGWIDENDEIFDKLVVWSRDKYGNDILYTLRELGIGAIFLGDIATEFSFKDDSNETLGIMRSTSFFLKQCGGSGTLSHVDLMH